MQLSGPFLIRGRATHTGFDLALGDRLIVLASGVLKARLPGQAFQEVTADGIPIPAPPDSAWPAPGLEILSLIARAGNQRSAMRDGIKIVAPVLTAPISDDVITLDVNAPPGTEFAPDTGFSVYVVKVPAGQTPPRLRNWISFRDLATAPTSIHGGIAAVILDGVIHVFYPQDGAHGPTLKHLTIDADGTVGPTDEVDSQTLVPPDPYYGTNFTKVSALVHRGTVNVFYCVQRLALGVLRRAVLNPSGAWDVFDVDGDAGAGTSGAMNGVVGSYNGAVSIGNTLHVLSHTPMETFIDRELQTIESNSPIEDLRHAAVEITGPEVIEAPFVWTASTIDGEGGTAGRVDGETGAGVSVMLDAASQVHAFYFLGMLTGRSGGSDLRHAELDWTGANTQSWRFETIDGAGRTLANATGQMSGPVGLGTGCVLHDGELHVAYNDNTHDNLRHGVKPPGSGWSFDTLDGAAHYNPGARYGATSFHVRRAPKAVVSLGDQVSIFYEDEEDRVVRHAFKRSGLPWMFETVDGDIAYGGRVRSAVQSPVAVIRDGFVNLFYYDTGRSRLRHAVLSQ